MEDIVSSLSFYELCKNLDKIVSVKKPRQRSAALRDFMEKQRCHLSTSKDPTVRKVNFYPIARLLLSHLDRDRGSYGIKENMLARRYIRVLGLAKESADARRLLNYRAPGSNQDLAGDFAAVACHVLQDLVSVVPSKLTVGDVNKLLDDLAEHSAKNNSAGVDGVLHSLLKHASANEQKWLIRILLKNNKLGLGKTSIFRAIHFDAEKLFDVCSSLKEVCEKLSDPGITINEVEISLASAFSPMLAERVDIGAFNKYFSEQKMLLCETKFDGERIQIHKQGNDQFKYFSRRGFDYTDKFGACAASPDGSLTPRLSALLSPTANTFIIDGEMMAWDRQKNAYKHKGQNTDVKFLKADGDIVPCFCAFDVLYHNGKVLTNTPLEDRLAILSTVFKEEIGVIMHTKRWPVKTKEDVVKSLNDAIDTLDEGIMIKDPKSLYKPNERNSGWWKVKPEYNNSLMENLDLIILGGYWGGGARSGIISQFLLGVATNPTPPDDVEFHSLCRVGSGYTRDELGMVMNRLQKHWQPQQPRNVKCIGTEKPDVWIDPKKSIVLEVKASEIVPSAAYYTQCSLRFPRTEKPRFDRSWHDCLTDARLKHIRKEFAGKLTKQHAAETTVSRRKRPPVIKADLPLASQFQPADTSNIKQETFILTDKVFCIVTGDGEQTSKQDLEKLVVKHGGTLVQNPGLKTWAVISHTADNLRVKNLVQQGLCGRPKCDILKASWLLKTIALGYLKLPEPIDILHSSFDTEQRLAITNDAHGDSYTSPATVDSIKFTIQNWKDAREDDQVSQEETLELEELLLEGTKFHNMFRPYLAYFDQFETLENSSTRNSSFWSMELVKLKFRLRGGKVSDKFEPEKIDLVIIDSDICTAHHLGDITAALHPNVAMFRIVKKEWVIHSIESGFCLPQADYLGT